MVIAYPMGGRRSVVWVTGRSIVVPVWMCRSRVLVVRGVNGFGPGTKERDEVRATLRSLDSGAKTELSITPEVRSFHLSDENGDRNFSTANNWGPCFRIWTFSWSALGNVSLPVGRDLCANDMNIMKPSFHYGKLEFKKESENSLGKKGQRGPARCRRVKHSLLS